MAVYCGVDSHARQQTVCFCDTTDGAVQLAELDHEADDVRGFYTRFAGEVIIGIEASGYSTRKHCIARHLLRMARWSCSMTLLRYFTRLSLQSAGKICSFTDVTNASEEVNTCLDREMRGRVESYAGRGGDHPPHRGIGPRLGHGAAARDEHPGCFRKSEPA